VGTKLPYRSVFVVLGLLLAACGGQDDTGPATTAAPSPTTEASSGTDGSVETTTPSVTDAGTTLGAGSAIVTVGDMRYEFIAPESFPLCTVQADGSITGVGYTIDFEPTLSGTTGASVTFAIQTNEWQDANPGLNDLDDQYIDLQDVANGLGFVSGQTFYVAGIEPGENRIVEWTLDGQGASGTALFIDSAANPAELVNGTFEISCG
jgi:hypothetical protein